MPHSFSLDDVYIGPPCPYNCHRRGVCKTGQCYCDETGAGNFSHGKETFRMVRDLLASVSKGCGFESQPSTSVSSPCLCDLLMLCKWQFFIWKTVCVFLLCRQSPTYFSWLTISVNYPWSLTDRLYEAFTCPTPALVLDWLYEPFTRPTPPLVLDWLSVWTIHLSNPTPGPWHHLYDPFTCSTPDPVKTPEQLEL